MGGKRHLKWRGVLLGALTLAVSQGATAGHTAVPEGHRSDIIAKFSSGTVVFNANGTAGTTSLQKGLVSLGTDNPNCIASPTTPCRYTINRIELETTNFTLSGTSVENVRAFNWYPALDVVDNGSGVRLAVPPGMTFNVSGDVQKTPVVFTVTPTAPSVLSLVVDPVLQQVTIMGSLKGSQSGWTLSLTVHATSDAPFANLPPLASAGPDQAVSTDCFALVSLDKSKTSDPNGNLAFSYFTENGYSVGDGSAPVAMFPGPHRLTLAAFDADGARGLDDVMINVKDNGTTKPVSGATTYTIETPPSLAAEAVGILATTSLIFKPDAALASSTGSANAVSLGNTGTSLWPNAAIQGDLWSIGPATLFPNAHVDGKLHSAAAVTLKPGASIGGGIDTSPVFAPPQILSWNVVMPAGPGPNISVAPGASSTINPGDYGDISLGPNSTLTLNAGTYTASSLNTKPNSTLQIQDADSPYLLSGPGSGAVSGSTSSLEAPVA